jgi:hypothetical protein
MKTWNVLTGVVQLVQAETAEEAERAAWARVSNAVDSFGDVFDLAGTGVSNLVFESESDE